VTGAAGPAAEVASLDGIGQAELVRWGEVSPAELVRWAIERIERLNPALNAVVTPMFDDAIARVNRGVSGPFAGVPYLLKDLVVESGGARFTEGSVFLRGNITGQPAMSVPLWWNADGLPIGVHFLGRFGDEATLFRLAAQLEQARPWAGRTPGVSARSRR
jgi:Asp-tRNA(Asn)/Glu-tRNA(Gln) amidotransferase A subunit family amidase